MVAMCSTAVETAAAMADRNLLKTGEAYVEQSAGSYEKQPRKHELRQLAHRLSKLGLTLAPATPVTLLLAA
jgi:hypothetical protein